MFAQKFKNRDKSELQNICIGFHVVASLNKSFAY
jgi:hypothetical protein